MIPWDDPHQRLLSRAATLFAGALLLLPPLAGLMSDAADGVAPTASIIAVSAAAASLLWGTLRRDIMFLLPGFLVTAAATTTGLSEPVREALLSGNRAATWWLVAMLYLLLALRACDRSRSVVAPVDQAPAPDPANVLRLRIHRLRTVTALALLVAPVTAAIATQPAPFSADLEVQAAVMFSGLLPFFLWVILFYVFFVAPETSRTLDSAHHRSEADRRWSAVRSLLLPIAALAVLLVFRGIL